jgi:alkylhydroperoxidase/carboxymuconolactone decarboxylase family protein YurZ
MSQKPPKTYTRFVERFPALGEAWDLMHTAGSEAGPIDERGRLLVKLAVAIGARREGAVHSAVRKARAQGIPLEDLEQVVALSASTIGLPSAVAVWTWVTEESGKKAGKKR